MIFADALEWLLSPANWSGPTSIPTRVGVHLLYCLAAVLGASAIAVPLGLWIGHTGRGGTVLVAGGNALRALPTLGLVTLLYLLLGGGQAGVVIALIVLAIPPLLAGAYAGVQDVDRGVVDAARGMGMTGSQVLWRVELPNALPLLLGGVRNATLQVVATASVAAYVGIETLGRPLLDGLRVLDYGQFVGGAVLIALLAVALDLLLAGVGRLLVPKGLTLGTRRRKGKLSATAAAQREVRGSKA
ncbi:ABC transporter permease [Actinosynnema mirum]|uniref:Binding-protein-dependent transport systems inner membrane component n=1 Tax=Actinosynnema mirum (strain ATCC 29888 / DSM 43827 / JCM 3225 / NBRC 14064 / NCIMB 13271 / NRRL B-12336 / IMRU 3971 / 101) TaxID=446462 RepID=C6WIZ7_ACTMD|nr:ABC transporter permease subunit [Actinosynnema mirum]ACU40073.1 binding-protein-dependent transport systems inner membrane component [Actinosynnema mirum DSM 43827]